MCGSPISAFTVIDVIEICSHIHQHASALAGYTHAHVHINHMLSCVASSVLMYSSQRMCIHDTFLRLQCRDKSGITRFCNTYILFLNCGNCLSIEHVIKLMSVNMYLPGKYNIRTCTCTCSICCCVVSQFVLTCIMCASTESLTPCVLYFFDNGSRYVIVLHCIF